MNIESLKLVSRKVELNGIEYSLFKTITSFETDDEKIFDILVRISNILKSKKELIPARLDFKIKDIQEEFHKKKYGKHIIIELEIKENKLKILSVYIDKKNQRLNKEIIINIE